jgi:spermidine synthase
VTAGEAASPATRGSFYLGVAALSAAMIASQITIMRVFSIGSWAHFGSLVIAIAMAGFGLASAIMCVARDHFHRRAIGWSTGALLAFGPLLVLGNWVAQSLGFNPIFLSAGPAQFWILLGVVGCYFMPFLASALFLGSAFLIGAARFGRVYFADLFGAGLAGILFLGALALVPPADLFLVPLALWLLACLAWAVATRTRLTAPAAIVLCALAAWFSVTGETIYTVPYKGVAYARHFPDARRPYVAWGPQGYLEVYSSSYFHFAPGLSDMAAIDLPSTPEDAYLGLFIDGDGPTGLMKPLSKDDQAYFRYLPMAMPFVIRPHADTFVVQFGGGISTRVALGLGAAKVVAAEANPMIPRALRSDALAGVTGHLLDDPRVTLIPAEGRIAIGQSGQQFDVVDLSLIDSIGLSSAGGLSVVEKYAYTEQALERYIRALKPDGILSMTVWNKENPPKAVPKLLATLLEAAEAVEPGAPGPRFFICHTYLSTATFLYRRGGFTPEEVEALRNHARHMTFDVIWAPGQTGDKAADEKILQAWSDPFQSDEPAPAPSDSDDDTKPDASGVTAEDDGAAGPDMSATALYRAMADEMMAGNGATVERLYGFGMSPVTDDRPYLAGYVKPGDLARALGHFDALADDWGFLLLWVSLAQCLVVGALLIALPVAFGWRTIFARQPGKLGLMGYFACLGLGYILVEVTLIAKFVRALGNPTVSASVMLTGMLVLSGLGALASTRIQASCRRFIPPILLAVAAVLALYGLALDPVIDWVGTLGFAGRLAAALALAGAPAFLMGFALPAAMTELGRLGKEPFFLWAWGINGLFSVGGAVAAPLIGILFGLDTAFWIAAACYALAAPSFFSVLRPRVA